jgi:hypothetical protein
VYYRQLLDGSFVYLLLYVDDMLIAAKNMLEIKKLKSLLSDEFEIKDLGAAKKILGRFTGIEKRESCTCHRKSTLRKYLNTLVCRIQNQ